MSARYVVADLVRNPRRTVSAMAGVVLGVGLFCGVLFFVDGLSASMTQRAVAPLPIDMQRIVTERFGGGPALTQAIEGGQTLEPGDRASVVLDFDNTGDVVANEVTVRSLPGAGLTYVAGSTAIDGTAIEGYDDNPLAHGAGQTGFNLGTVAPGGTRRITYLVEATAGADPQATVASTYSTRESVGPRAANGPGAVPLDDLAQQVGALDGVRHASQLSIADLGADALVGTDSTVTGPAKIFGFDDAYAARDSSIEIVQGEIGDGAALSAEAATALGASIGDTVSALLPDGSIIDLDVSGIADLTRSRSLFSSRRGGDLETFVYVRNSIIVSPDRFAAEVQPAFERAAADGSARLKSPPIREIDITLERQLLDADPTTAAAQTRAIAERVTAIADHQDYLLDNITNTLDVAAADADVAKRLFVFLGLPGALLAAALAAYAGNVLAEAQRREQATLRIRGASRRHLVRMLALRTMLLTACGSVVGLMAGYLAAVAVLGRESLDRASTTSLATSAVIGTLGGFVATGLALYTTGRRSIDREIAEDRARLTRGAPLWRRARADIVGLALLLVGTALAVRADAFAGTPGSVYFGRSVELNLMLLALPVAVWLTGSLFAARVLGGVLDRTQPHSSARLGRPLPSLYRLSVGRRPWAIGNGAIVASLIVALATSLAVFTSSYDAAKVVDARFANGADIRVAPSPTSQRTYGIDDATLFETDGVAGVTPVVYGPSNVILRSARTSDPANLAAIDPASFARVAPLPRGSAASGVTASDLAVLASDPSAVLVSTDMAAFLQAAPGDTLDVLLARATENQVEVEMTIAGLFERVPGFPDGADAIMSIHEHTVHVPDKPPDFFLARAAGPDAGALHAAVAALEQGPLATDRFQLDTRETTLARDQSSLAALNVAGLVDLDTWFALAMAVVTIAIFVFGLLLQRRREYVTLRAQGLEPGTIRLLITIEAGTVAVAGALAGVLVGIAMGAYFVTVLRPLFVLSPAYVVTFEAIALPVGLVVVATIVSALVGSRLVNRLDPTELLRDE